MNSSSIKVTHIITGLEVGGAERALFTTLTSGLEGPFCNHVISLSGPGFYGPKLEAAGIPVTSLNLRGKKFNSRDLLQFLKALKTSPPSILQGWMPHGNFVAFLGWRLFCKRSSLVWNIRNANNSKVHQPLLSRLISRFNSFVSASPRTVIYNSHAASKLHESAGFRCPNWCVIPNGFDTNLWRPNVSDRRAVRRELALEDTDRVIGYVGRGHHDKDIPNLFTAVEKANCKEPRVVLVGVGRDLEKFGVPPKRYISLGQCDNIPRLMRAFDILCLTSRVEGFPNVLGEAMASGVPCVSTDVGDAKTIISETGWVVPAGDTEALSHAILRAFGTSVSVLKKRSVAARQRIEQEYSIKKAVSSYAALYDQLKEKVI